MTPVLGNTGYSTLPASQKVPLASTALEAQVWSAVRLMAFGGEGVSGDQALSEECGSIVLLLQSF